MNNAAGKFRVIDIHPIVYYGNRDIFAFGDLPGRFNIDMVVDYFSFDFGFAQMPLKGVRRAFEAPFLYQFRGDSIRRFYLSGWIQQWTKMASPVPSSAETK